MNSEIRDEMRAVIVKLVKAWKKDKLQSTPFPELVNSWASEYFPGELGTEFRLVFSAKPRTMTSTEKRLKTQREKR